MPTHALLRTGLALTSVLLVSAALFGSARSTPVAAAATTTHTTVLEARFDNTVVGPVDPTSFRNAVGPTNTDWTAYRGMTYRPDYRGYGGNVVRHKLAAWKYIGSTGEGRGNVLMIKLPGSYDSACMSYDVRFAYPFEFSAGGKLPGFVGVAPGTPPTTPEGGGSTEHGWSGRLMWLGSKMWSFVRSADRSNMVVTYLYHPNQSGKYGDNLSWGTGFTPGVWHRVRQCHAMNTIGKSDGVLRTWFDGQLVIDRWNLVYRTDPAVHITHFDWSVFRGGNSMEWAASTDGYVDIDNLKITAG